MFNRCNSRAWFLVDHQSFFWRYLTVYFRFWVLFFDVVFKKKKLFARFLTLVLVIGDQQPQHWRTPYSSWSGLLQSCFFLHPIRNMFMCVLFFYGAWCFWQFGYSRSLVDVEGEAPDKYLWVQLGKSEGSSTNLVAFPCIPHTFMYIWCHFSEPK